MRVLARTWQMLLKGIAEVQEAGRPLAAAEMVLVRIAYAADLPTPDEAIRLLADAPGGSGPGPRLRLQRQRVLNRRPRGEGPRGCNTRGARAGPSAGPDAGRRCRRPISTRTNRQARQLASFAALVALAGEKRDLGIKSALERSVRLVRFEDGRIEIALEENAPKASSVSSLKSSPTGLENVGW